MCSGGLGEPPSLFGVVPASAPRGGLRSDNGLDMFSVCGGVAWGDCDCGNGEEAGDVLAGKVGDGNSRGCLGELCARGSGGSTEDADNSFTFVPCG